jgi:(S)-2-hydroxyglutarate dehydrogenase
VSGTPRYDLVVIGGGIIGIATARALSGRLRGSLAVLEAESALARHQSGHNSGVIHSGLYYKPGSLKARNCVEGRDLMYRFCEEHAVRHERCGKVVVATSERELPSLVELERRGRANGLEGMRRLGPEEIRELEPNVAGIAGLHVPQTGIVDYTRVIELLADEIRAAGGDILLGARVHRVRRMGGDLVLETARGPVTARALVNCAGLQSDRVARLCGVQPGLQIVPFRGEYYELRPQRRGLVRNLVYPVPDPAFPFLGVHFTRLIDGGVEAGPNAVLAWKREGYRHRDVSVRDLAQMARYGGFWRMAGRYWMTGMGEMYRSVSKGAFVNALRRLVPDLREDDIVRSGAGVRAQAVEPNGLLCDDFRIVEAEGMVHVLNAPSPGATASISIGRTIADLAARRFGSGRGA